jgi:glucokinase
MNDAADNVTPNKSAIYVGVDVGGTSIKIGLIYESGKIIWYGNIPTHADREPADAIERVSTAIKSAFEQLDQSYDDLAAIGLATPGTMDIPAGMILEPPNLPGWRHFAIRQALGKATQKPVVFANDANAAAFGEYWLGSGTQYQSMLLLTLGTGVGGGIIVFEKTIDGANSLGGEIGHTIVDTSPHARICSCGQRGHLEAYASATAVTRRADEAIESGRETSLRCLVDDHQPLTALSICEHAEAGDAFANEIILDTADFLAIGILNAAHMLDPQGIILGGAMNFGGTETAVGKMFLERIRNEVKRMTFPVMRNKVHIDFALLGGKAGFVGAAGIARSMHQKSASIDLPGQPA